MKKLLIAFVFLFLTTSAFARGGAQIGYLVQNSNKYEASFQEINGNQIYWTINSDSYRAIRTVIQHVAFMKDRLERGAHPRSWDKFFVIDAAMHKYVNTSYIYNRSQAIVVKEASNACAYTIIKTHAEVLRDEFFKGNIREDHSEIADRIIDSPECVEYKPYLVEEVSKYWNPK